MVLWMQPDGTLNPSADPPELPDPSDSGASYWLARTIWALGEGYRAFRDEDPEFARFLRARLELAIDAVDRQVLTPNYGEFQTVDGLQWPSWLIVDGADASSEAIYGLSAYQQAGGSPRRTSRLAATRERGCPDATRLSGAMAVSGDHALGPVAIGVARLGRSDVRSVGHRRRHASRNPGGSMLRCGKWGASRPTF